MCIVKRLKPKTSGERVNEQKRTSRIALQKLWKNISLKIIWQIKRLVKQMIFCKDDEILNCNLMPLCIKIY